MTSYDITIGEREIRALSYAVNEALTKWPGAPARPYHEQETLHALKMSFFSLTMELGLEQDGKRSEGNGPS